MLRREEPQATERPLVGGVGEGYALREAAFVAANDVRQTTIYRGVGEGSSVETINRFTPDQRRELDAIQAEGAKADVAGFNRARKNTGLLDRSKEPLVEVYDPNTGFVWENVGVRIVQAEQEWSGCVCVNPIGEDWYFTDEFGTVLFNSDDLAIADVGFLLDAFGRAVMSPDVLEDEAIVLLEVYAPGFGSVYQEVDLSWDEPRVYVPIPY